MNSNWIPEISEKNGLDLLNGNEKRILSIGISTNGNAEIYMAQKCKDAKIIATTIDESFFLRIAITGGSAVSITSVALTTDTCSASYV